jgi:hypothetical protein
MNPFERGLRTVDAWQQRHRVTAFIFAVFKKFGVRAVRVGPIWVRPRLIATATAGSPAAARARRFTWTSLGCGSSGAGAA